MSGLESAIGTHHAMRCKSARQTHLWGHHKPDHGLYCQGALVSAACASGKTASAHGTPSAGQAVPPDLLEMALCVVQAMAKL